MIVENIRRREQRQREPARDQAPGEEEWSEFLRSRHAGEEVWGALRAAAGGRRGGSAPRLAIAGPSYLAFLLMRDEGGLVVLAHLRDHAEHGGS